MNKKIILGVVALIVVLGGTTFALTQGGDETANTNQTSPTNSSGSSPSESEAMEKEKMEKDKMVKEGDAMSANGGYVTVADYNKDKASYASSKKVYFFHANWCPICQKIDKAINADPSKIPAKTVLIKADFDKETSLRQQYGVTQQYTFVEFDNDGKQIKKFSASSLDAVLEKI